MKKLIKKISKFFSSVDEPFTGLEDDCRIYCIGDIHGRFDLLLQLHEKIRLDAKNYDNPVKIIYVGDYIDRGPDSEKVINYLLSDTFSDFESIFLMGNHERVLLDFLRDPAAGSAWFSFGGLSTLASYGVQIKGIPHAAELATLSSELKEKIPAEHLYFYQQLLPFYQQGAYYFAHAGVRPRIDLKHQRPEDLLWIRDKFLDSHKFHGKIIVHGHSVIDKVVVLRNRIGVDTGAYASNILSCVVLEGLEQRIIST